MIPDKKFSENYITEYELMRFFEGVYSLDIDLLTAQALLIDTENVKKIHGIDIHTKDKKEVKISSQIIEEIKSNE